MSDDKPTRFVWCDLETTGLDPNEDKILEFSIGLTPRMFEIPPAPFTLVVKFNESIDEDVVFDMHAKSGLLTACRKSERRIEDVEFNVLLALGFPGDRTLTIAGASAHFDLSFIRRHMPKLARAFTHRVLDTTALGLFAEAMGMPKVNRSATAHRAEADMLEAWQRMQNIRSWFEANGFKVPA